MYDPNLKILNCPVCHSKGKVYLEESHPKEICAYVGCDSNTGCGFYVEDVKRLKTTEIAKELLKHAAIRKWNTNVKEHKDV